MSYHHTPEPAPAALRQAWARMSSPARPTTLEAALAHPVWGICVRAAARQAPATHWPQVGAHPAQAAQLGTRIGPRIARAVPTTTTPAADRKRLAANDRDD